MKEQTMKKVLILLALAAMAIPAAAASGIGTASAGPGGGRAVDAKQMEVLTLTLRNTRYGRILFDGKSRVLYGFTRDRRGGPSQCYGACARAWPVYFAKGRLQAGSGVNRRLLGTVRRRDGRRQITYNGWPLYYYAHEGPREVKCQNVREFGGLWLVVKPNGRLVR
jgi:predicted lipoprotein with Yx(FWY)xxD motif